MARGRIWAVLAIGLLLPACGTGGGGGTLTPTIAPGIPSALLALSGNKRVTLSWTAPASGSTFTVKRSLTSGGPYFPVSVPAGFAAPTTYIDSGLTNQTDYYYVVSASNQFGQSADSTEVKGTPGFIATFVAAGPAAFHTLAVLQDRTLWACGANTFGQLGNGRTSGQSAIPSLVLGLDGVTAAATGEHHSVALRNDGSVWAWGRNDIGQLGQGSTSGPTGLPIPVPGLTAIVALAAGKDHTLALRNDGTVWGWGDNRSGQIGNGTSGATPITAPFQIPGLSNVKAVAAGGLHSLAIRNEGTVWSWGDNTQGQLGNGASSATPVTIPTEVPNLTAVTAIAGGELHSIISRADGSVWIWGSNSSGILGIGGAGVVPQPARVPAVTQAIDVAAGNGTSYALLIDGSVMAWGSNGQGQSGIGAILPAFVTTPTVIPSLRFASAIAAGRSHALALRDDGSVLAWGYSGNGQSGNGLGTNYNAPVQVPNFTDVTAVALGPQHTVALRGDGTVWTWGDNTSGQLGNGVVLAGYTATPFKVPGLTGMIAVAASPRNSYAVKDDGSIWAWGANGDSQLGQNTSSVSPTPSPVKVLNLTGIFISVAAGSGHVIALRNDGTLWGWGSNVVGELGTGSLIPSIHGIPIQVAGLTGVTAISSGILHTMALKNDGTVWTWGWNTDGQIGNGSAPDTRVPDVQQVLTGAASISAGEQFSLVAKSDGTVWGWGRRDLGQVGDGVVSPTPVLSPVQSPNISGVSKVAAGTFHSLALKTDGSVWAWGYNVYGQLGNGDETASAIPVQPLTLAGATTLAAGGYSSMAILPDKSLWGWGANIYKQLGINVITAVTVPTTIQP